MKIILAGHPGSRKVRKAALHLVNKYMPGFDVRVFEHGGDVRGWASHMAEQLGALTDDRVIFALDDYLLAKPLRRDMYELLLANMDDDAVCARLCDSTFYQDALREGDLIRVGVEDYTCTTQYCIWDREALINVLEQVQTPWEFELEGSGFMNRISYQVIGTQPPALEYNTNSALSSRWEGVDLKGLSEEDAKEVQKLL